MIVAYLVGFIPKATPIGELHMGIEIFKDIQNATIISKSNVENSFNKIIKEYDGEVATALIEIAKFIEESGDVSAGILFDKFNEELNQPQPDKSKLKRYGMELKKHFHQLKCYQKWLLNWHHYSDMNIMTFFFV